MLLDTSPTTIATLCFHCGEECDEGILSADDKSFCCTGCRTVYELLKDNDLCTYYGFEERGGLSFKRSQAARFEYLDDEAVQRALLQFRDGTIARTTFRLPQIHCTSCIWLLENLYRINSAILRSEVNFLKQEIAVTFREREVSLREVVSLLARLGYEPEIRLASMTQSAGQRAANGNWPLYLKIGLAGFAFGNVMLLAFPDYLDSTGLLSAQYKSVFGWLSLLLATPVLLYSASDYFISSWHALRQRNISLDVPVALGIVALYFRSVFDIVNGTGTGYLDSFTGLVFFLLIGRLFQKKTFAALSFDRNYAAWFPLSVTVRRAGTETTVPVSGLQPGETILVRNQELVPTDSVLLSATAQIDYSFVTGEADPVTISSGNTVYAGGRVIGPGAELSVIREVSHSYLTQLWNNDAFQKEKRSSLVDITDAFGKRFTLVVGLIAFATLLYWLPDVDKALSAFTAVLIIACPCALTLAAPFTLGTTVAILGKAKFYLKNIGVVTDLAALNALVFDKTGTLTHADRAAVRFTGTPLNEAERAMLAACLRHSTHPLSRQILAALSPVNFPATTDFYEIAGRGIECLVNNHRIVLGSAAWVIQQAGAAPGLPDKAAVVHLAIDGEYRGSFQAGNVYREGLRDLLAALQTDCELYLLSGDNDRERATLQEIFGTEGRFAFQQSPAEKLNFVKKLREQNKVVGMIGDGLNDAGALRQSNVGIALTEDTSAFTPACDAILAAERLQRLPVYIGFAKYALRVLLACLLLSLVYNAVGLSFAVTGRLSPLVTAILMPISSLNVVALAWGAMKIREKEIVQ